MLSSTERRTTRLDENTAFAEAKPPATEDIAFAEAKPPATEVETLQEPRRASISEACPEALLADLLAPVIADPSLLRGVPPSTILWRLGYWMRSGPILGKAAPLAEEGDGQYALSFQLEELDRFLSHSWHANGKLKVLCLFAFYNGVPAVCAGLIAVAICVVALLLGTLPEWNEDAMNDWFGTWAAEFPRRVPYSGWCTLSYTVAYIATLVYWQSLRKIVMRNQLNDGVFLDKLCIHQTNVPLKLAGIAAIGAHCIRSRHLTIAWDTTYFERMWCIFEVAIFWRLKRPHGHVELIPIPIYAAEALLAVLVSVTFTTMAGAHALNVPQTLFVSWMDIGLPQVLVNACLFPFMFPVWALMAFVLRKYSRGHRDVNHQLQTFSIANLKCFSEADREFVLASIRQIYQTESEFEAHVRTDLRKEILGIFEDSGGGRVPFWTVTRSVTVVTWVFYGPDLLFAVRGIDSSYCLSWGIIMSTVVLVQIPVYMSLFGATSGLYLDSPSLKCELVLCSAISVFMSLVIIAWFACIPLMMGASVEVQVLVILVSVLANLCCYSPLGPPFATWLRNRSTLTRYMSKMAESEPLGEPPSAGSASRSVRVRPAP